MFRLLLPGIRLKRWVLVSLAGVLVFAIGFALLVTPGLGLHINLWQLWNKLTGGDMPTTVPVILGVALLLSGLGLVSLGTRRLIRAFIVVANPRTTGKQLLNTLMERRSATPRLRVVGIGGGTGLSTLLRGLKAYPVDLTAIVTVTDDGGSSGRLRTTLDMPPPGDIRSCLLALAEAEPLMERLFEHRFAPNSGLDGHSLGNLIIAGLREVTGDFQQAVQEASRVLAVRGRVLPSAKRALVLKATMADGSVVYGETAIVAQNGVVTNIEVEPADVPPLPEALEAIRQADVIIVGPGSIYSSLLPNLVIPEMAAAIADAEAIKFFVCNVMTQPGESDQFSASRHLRVVLDHLPNGNPFHYAVVNLQVPPQNVMAHYAEKGQQLVEADLVQMKALGVAPVTGGLLADAQDAHLARHDPEKLARCILETVVNITGWTELLRKHA